MTFTPSPAGCSQCLQRLSRLVMALHEVDDRTLANNLAAMTCQGLFSVLIDPSRTTSHQLQAQRVLMDLAVVAINTAGQQPPLFLQRFSPAVFKFVDTLALNGEAMKLPAAWRLIDWFALYSTNTDFFWPWNKWWEFRRGVTQGGSGAVRSHGAIPPSHLPVRHGHGGVGGKTRACREDSGVGFAPRGDGAIFADAADPRPE